MEERVLRQVHDVEIIVEEIRPWNASDDAQHLHDVRHPQQLLEELKRSRMAVISHLIQWMNADMLEVVTANNTILRPSIS